VAFARQLGAETLVVVLNCNHYPVTLNLPVDSYLDDGTTLQDVWGDMRLTVVQGQIRDVPIPDRAGAVLKAIRAPKCNE
jgi:hypothetical protein